jgi:1,4-alpha-glucan branching enzyme
LRYEDAILSVVAGDHPDPFSFLGMHRSEDGFVVRAFLPGASAVEVVSDSGDVLGALDPVHPGGIFAGPVARMVPYRLRVAWEGDGEAEIEDP